jgi:tRNA(Ile)-lysidine synthase
MLLQQFKAFVTQKLLINPSDKLLLAVSGGVDSMVLFHLCLKAGYHVGVAHVNFKLRAAAADADEALVIATCKTHQIECFTTNFDTQNYAHQNKLSIQMAARELRYNYFNSLINQHHFTKLVTAHHADDHIETFFINLLRSSGIKGLTGIPRHNEIIIRPLLFATKNQIERYAQTHHIKFNTDSSNLKDDYLRNHLRHHVIPAIKEAAPNADTQILNSIQHLNDDANLLQELHQKTFEHLTSSHPHGLSINKTKLLHYHHAANLLFWYLKNYGFNSTQIKDMLAIGNLKSGQIFYSQTHQIVQNKEELILSQITSKAANKTIIVSSIHQNIESPIPLKITLLTTRDTNYKHAQNHEIFVDAAKIQFPLTLREWQKGDQMQPLGMKNYKKVSDILIDKKIDILTKANTYVLCNSNQEIIWLIGHRVSEHFKIDVQSKNVLHLSTK